MDANINVTNCRLQIVRKGGWSWGASQREIANQAARILPELILQRIASTLPFDGDAELGAPVRLRIALKRKDLLSLLSAGSVLSVRSSHSVVASIDEAIEMSGLVNNVEQIVERTGSTSAITDSSKRDYAGKKSKSFDAAGQFNAASSRSSDDSGSFQLRTKEKTSLLTLLEKHFRLGSLALFLNQLSTATLVEWDQALSRIVEVGPSCERSTQPPNEKAAKAPSFDASGSQLEIGMTFTSTTNMGMVGQLGHVVLEIANTMPQDSDLKARTSYRIHATLVAYVKCGIMPGNIELRRLLEQHLPIQGSTHAVHTNGSNTNFSKLEFGKSNDARSYDARSIDEKSFDDNRIPLRTTRPSHQSTNHTNNFPKQMFFGEMQVDSVLPFLLLGPLTRAGYLETIAVSLEAAGSEHYSQAFAFALALKVLGKPVCGQMRNSGATQSATAFAGTDQWQGDGIGNLGAHADQFCSALNAHLVNELLPEHSIDNPLLLSHAPILEESKLLLSDPRGMFPLAVMQNAKELGSILCRGDSQLLLVTSQIVTTELLDSLTELGCRFVMESPPTRGESYRRVRDRSGKRYWTNDTTTNAHKLGKAGCELTDCEPTIVEFWREVGLNPVDHLARNSMLDESLSLAAGLGLAQIAWELWRDREPTHPLLTLERFKDLSGVVSFSSDMVRVKLPLGRRASDLASHGMLEDVDFVPWLDGRRIAFSQG